MAFSDRIAELETWALSDDRFGSEKVSIRRHPAEGPEPWTTDIDALVLDPDEAERDVVLDTEFSEITHAAPDVVIVPKSQAAAAGTLEPNRTDVLREKDGRILRPWRIRESEGSLELAGRWEDPQ